MDVALFSLTVTQFHSNAAASHILQDSFVVVEFRCSIVTACFSYLASGNERGGPQMRFSIYFVLLL